MSSDGIRSLVRVSCESGPLFDHLQSIPTNKRADRIRTLAYMGLIVERGLLNSAGAVLPVGKAPANEVHASGTIDAASPRPERTATPPSENKVAVTIFDVSDLEHMGM
jgi:hypothetical protein